MVDYSTFSTFIVVDEGENDIVEYFNNIEDAKSFVEQLMDDAEDTIRKLSIYALCETPKIKVIWKE